MRQTVPGFRVVTGLPLAVLFALAGCALPQPPAPPAAVAAAPAPTGTILSARPVPRHSAGARRSVLAAIGVRPEAAPAVAPAVEFIVRARDGTIISVIQPAAGGLHPGARVRILFGPATRIAPLLSPP